MIRRHFDLIFLFILTITVVVLRIIGIEGGMVMKLTGAVFVLFAPGYAVTAAVFKEDVLELPAKIALGIGISLAISAVGGIGLYGTGALLTRTSWTVFLSIVILISSIVALVQRSRNTSYMPKEVTRKLGFSEILLLTFSMLALGSGIYLARTAEQNQNYEPFTEFWIVPQTEDISDIEVGLHNYEQTSMLYDISVRINEREVETWENISVLPDQVWNRTYTLPPKESSNETVTVYLYRGDDFTEPYRWGQLYR
jgi:uncharacterized membrane protein